MRNFLFEVFFFAKQNTRNLPPLPVSQSLSLYRIVFYFVEGEFGRFLFDPRFVFVLESIPLITSYNIQA